MGAVHPTKKTWSEAGNDKLPDAAGSGQRAAGGSTVGRTYSRVPYNRRNSSASGK